MNCNKNIYFRFLSFLEVEIAQVLKNNSFWKPRTSLSYTVNAIVADDLTTQELEYQ